MTDSAVIGLRVRPWTLNGNHLTRTSKQQQVDVWSIEKCIIQSYSDGKAYLNWKSIYDFLSEKQAFKQMQAMQSQLTEYPRPRNPASPQAGDLILLQAPGKLSGSLGLIEGIYGEFANEFDVRLDSETCLISDTNFSRQLLGTGGLQYKIKQNLLVDTQEVVYHEFMQQCSSKNENKVVQLPVRLYLLKIEAQSSVDHRKTA